MKKLVAIDGNSIMNRAFYGIMNSKLLMTTDGIYTNAIYGFLTILLKMINDEKPDYLCVAFDLKAPTFRHKKYEDYKGTRKGMPDELRVQMPIIKDVLRAMNITICELEGYEADDIIGTLSKKAEEEGMKTLLLTGDKDYLQLATENVTVRIPTTKMGNTESTDYTPEVIKEKLEEDYQNDNISEMEIFLSTFLFFDLKGEKYTEALNRFISYFNKAYIADACFFKISSYYYTSNDNGLDKILLNALSDMYIRIHQSKKSNKYLDKSKVMKMLINNKK